MSDEIDPADDRFLKESEAARRYGVSPRTLQMWDKPR